MYLSWTGFLLTSALIDTLLLFERTFLHRTPTSRTTANKESRTLTYWPFYLCFNLCPCRLPPFNWKPFLLRVFLFAATSISTQTHEMTHLEKLLCYQKHRLQVILGITELTLQAQSQKNPDFQRDIHFQPEYLAGTGCTEMLIMQAWLTDWLRAFFAVTYLKFKLHPFEDGQNNLAFWEVHRDIDCLLCADDMEVSSISISNYQRRALRAKAA